MTEEDLPMVLAWRNHPKNRCFMFTQKEISLEEHTQWFIRVAQDNTRHLLIVQEGGVSIGCVQFSNVEPGGVADWGFYTSPGSAKGTGRKLGVSALDHAFSQLKLHKVCGQVIARNQASIRFHERLGFRREAELRDQKRIDDQYQTIICYGLLAYEWQIYAEGTQT
jgi:UDP-4-amino-4,6-dideoxy-N-acetyl-beta-L-altrosamine N-acetyltransferase